MARFEPATLAWGPPIDTPRLGGLLGRTLATVDGTLVTLGPQKRRVLTWSAATGWVRGAALSWPNAPAHLVTSWVAAVPGRRVAMSLAAAPVLLLVELDDLA